SKRWNKPFASGGPDPQSADAQIRITRKSLKEMLYVQEVQLGTQRIGSCVHGLRASTGVPFNSGASVRRIAPSHRTAHPPVHSAPPEVVRDSVRLYEKRERAEQRQRTREAMFVHSTAARASCIERLHFRECRSRTLS